MQVGQYNYVSGDLTEEESKDETLINPKLQPYTQYKNCTTEIFTSLLPEQVLACILKSLEDKDKSFNVSKTKWRINYTKKRTFAGSLDEDDLQTFQEMVKI